jgi:hypothetical protein
MHSLWTSHLKQNEKEKFTQYVKNNTTLLNRLRDIVDEKIKSAERSQIDKENYDSAAWPYLQADLIGTIRALKSIRDIINVDKE